jgi:hypothetical protein
MENVLVRALETGREAIFCPFSLRVELLILFTNNERLLCLSCNVKMFMATCLNRAETSVVLTVFYHLCAFTITFSYCRST